MDIHGVGALCLVASVWMVNGFLDFCRRPWTRIFTNLVIELSVVRGKNRPTGCVGRSRETCPGDVGFEIGSAGENGGAQGRFKKRSRPGLDGASVRVVGTLAWPTN